jgi:hypothetical protein
MSNKKRPRVSLRRLRNILEGVSVGKINQMPNQLAALALDPFSRKEGALEERRSFRQFSGCDPHRFYTHER